MDVDLIEEHPAILNSNIEDMEIDLFEERSKKMVKKVEAKMS